MKRLWPLLIPIAVALFVCYPFFRSGYFATDDGQWAIVRLAEMKREGRDLQLPPRWAGFLNHGYGYPLFSFTYPLPYYLGALISAAGVDLTTTIKLLFVASVVLSGIGMFFLGREMAGTRAGVIASVLYVVAPFRLVDLYVRGSLGESLSLAVFPWMCYAGVLYILKPSAVRMVFCSALLAVMILTHNAMALLFLPWWGLFLLVMVSSFSESVMYYLWRYFLPMGLLGVGLAGYFLVPALAEKQFISLSITPLTDISQHFLGWQQLVSSPWTHADTTQFALGIAHLGALCLSLLVYIFSGALERKKHRGLVLFLCAFFLISWFLTTADSLYIWQNTLLSNIDFPWRIVPVLLFFLSLGTIFLGVFLPTSIIGGMLCIAAIVLAVGYISPQQPVHQPDTYYLTNDATTTSADELLPVWVKEKPTNRPAQPAVITAGTGTITTNFSNSYRLNMTVQAATPVSVQVQTIYYPGWRFSEQGQVLAVSHDNPKGVMELNLAAGTHDVAGVFRETPLRSLADWVSVTAVGICLFLLLWSFIDWLRSRRTVAETVPETLV